MAKNLIELIRASGSSGTNNQSFRNNVAGSPTTGTSMRSYLLGSPVYYDGTPAPENTYASGTTFNIGVTFSGYGSNFSYIRNPASSWVNYGSATQTLNSVSWDDLNSKATLNVTVKGDYDSTTLPSLVNFDVYYDGYSRPNQPPDGVVNVSVFPVATGGGSASGSTTKTLQYTYDPDSANFNPSISTDSWPVSVYKIAYDSWPMTYEWEIHSDSSYSNLLGYNGFSFQSDNTTVITPVGYIRYRIRADYNGGTAGSWVNYGAISWTDDRPDL